MVAAGLVMVAAVGPAVAISLMMVAATPVSTPSRIDVGPDCTVQPAAPAAEVATGSQRVLCGGERLDMSWEAFSPRSTAGPVMSARRRMVAAARTEGIQEQWLDPGDGTFSAWRVMKSTEPAYLIAVSVWIDGKPVRPGLQMRLRMALNSLLGSPYTPMVVTVTPVVDWEARNGSDLKTAEDALPHFLRTHSSLNETVGALSLLR